MVSAAPPPERFVTQRAECWCQAMPHRLAPSPKGALSVGLKEPTAIALRTLRFRFAICPGVARRGRAVLLLA